MSDPLVSVVIPTYNGAQFIAEALHSVRAQEYHPTETIVVDDGSTDASAAIIQAFAGVRYIHQHNQGVGAARNTGVRAATGEFIAFLDQDDRWTPPKLRLQVDYLRQYPEAGGVLAHHQVVLEEATPWPSWLKSETPDNQSALMPSTLVVHKSIFEQVGYFNPEYRIASEWEWMARVKQAGITLSVLPEVLVQYRVHTTNASHRRQVLQKELFDIVRRSVERQRRT